MQHCVVGAYAYVAVVVAAEVVAIHEIVAVKTRQNINMQRTQENMDH